jgi:hypothetical protein
MHRRLLAEEAVALGLRHIIRQRERIAELTRDEETASRHKSSWKLSWLCRKNTLRIATSCYANSNRKSKLRPGWCTIGTREP